MDQPIPDERLQLIQNDIKYIKEMLNLIAQDIVRFANQEYENSQAIATQNMQLYNALIVPDNIPEPPKAPEQKPKRSFLGFGAADYSKR
jgi:hypothetical protein